MVAKKLRIGAAFLALYAISPSVLAGDKDPTLNKYTNPDAQKLRDAIAAGRARIQTIQNNPNLSSETKATLVEGAEAEIAQYEQLLSVEAHDENAVNRKAGKILRDAVEILETQNEIIAANAQWSEDQSKGVVYTAEQIQALRDQQDRRVARVRFLENRIGRKKDQITKKGGNFDSMISKPVVVTPVKTDPSIKPNPITLTDEEKRKKSECWEEGGEPIQITKFFDLGNSHIDSNGEIQIGKDKTSPAFRNAVQEAVKSVTLGKDFKIGHVDVLVHNSRVGPVLPKGISDAEKERRTQEFQGALAQDRANGAIEEFKNALNESASGKTGTGWKDSFTPKTSFVAGEDFSKRKRARGSGPKASPGDVLSMKGESVDRKKMPDGNSFYCPINNGEAGDLKNCYTELPDSKKKELAKDFDIDGLRKTRDKYLNKVPREQDVIDAFNASIYDVEHLDYCMLDDLCRRAKDLFNFRKISPSPALVTTVDNSGKVLLDRQETMKNLSKCCASNAADLVFKPHQYVEVSIYPAKFNPNVDACVDPSKKYGGGSKKLEPPTPCGSDDDSSCWVEYQKKMDAYKKATGAN